MFPRWSRLGPLATGTGWLVRARHARRAASFRRARPIPWSLLFLLLSCAPPAQAGEAVPRVSLPNGLFIDGKGEAPFGWGQNFFDGKATRFSWTPGGPGPGVASLTNDRPNDASWVQRVRVAPSTWYLVSGWVRAEGVGEQGAGARLGILRSFRESEQMHDTTDWRHLSFWVQTDESETALDVACRLGGPSALALGTVHCTGLSIEPAGTPDLDARFVFPNEARSAQTRLLQIGGPSAIVLGGLLLLAWRFLLPESARIPR
ncbi:MAG: hypothetical protein RL698_1331 [Pseudomonadota bacterium]